MLDVGCGNGFILAPFECAFGRSVVGVDLADTTEAPISVRTLRWAQPCRSKTWRLDAVCFSFVLHHARNFTGLLREAMRVVRPGGRILVYEDIPERWHDRALCLWHERQWHMRTGACTFLQSESWIDLFQALGLRVAHRRVLSLSEGNPMHPVQGALFVLEREVRTGCVPA